MAAEGIGSVAIGVAIGVENGIQGPREADRQKRG